MPRRLLILIAGVFGSAAILMSIVAIVASVPVSAPRVIKTATFSSSTDDGVTVTDATPEEDVNGLPSSLRPEPLINTTSSSVRVITNARVTRVSDGDTVIVTFDNGEAATVRLLGVNTPETVDPRKPVECFGKEASDFTKRYLTNARIRLEADPQADERDKYGRLLRSVILEDGTDYNALLVKDGYAYAYLSFPLASARKRELRLLEADARNHGRGLWGAGCVSTP
jgi:micrococcal nuclease